jgi:threonine dehydrogenase-like Zn-dependent dehydrogenase
MRAVVCHETELSVRELPDPVPGAGQIVLEVVRCGICGSDLHAREHGDVVADAAAKIGIDDVFRRRDEVVFGHEFSGRVLDYGPRTRGNWARGTPVVAFPMYREGDRTRMTGLSPNAPGAYAERVLVQECMTMPIPNGYSPELAAMTEPMAVALHAVRKSRIGKKETAVVIGCGPIGLAVILMLKARGVRHVVASDFSAVRRDLAVQCGADDVVDPAATSPWAGFADSRKYYTRAPQVLDLAFSSMEQLRKVPLLPWAKVMRAAEKAGATPSGPVVFECVGVPGMIEHVIDSAPLYSRVVVVGVCMEPDTISPAMGVNKELSLQFVFAYDPSEYHQTLHLMADGKVDASLLHTDTIGLADVPAMFDELGSAEGQAKVLIDPSR